MFTFDPPLPAMPTRTFVLVPAGAPPAPAGVSFRRGWLRRDLTEVVVTERAGSYTLGVTVTGQRTMEQPLPPQLGEALLATTAPTQVHVAMAESGPWTVRVYEEALWGLVLGEVELAPGLPIPEAPSGWRVGREVTNQGRYQDRTLAHLAPDAARLVVDTATRLV